MSRDPAQFKPKLVSFLQLSCTRCFQAAGALASIAVTIFLADHTPTKQKQEDHGFALSDEGIGHVGDNDSVPLDKDGGFKQDG